MPDEAILRERAREVVRQGKLPARRPDRTWGAPAWELNIASDDPDLARQLERIWADDLTRAHEVTLEEWRSRGIGRLFELFVLPLQEQL